MDYLEFCKQNGIDRGQLDHGFVMDGRSTLGKEQQYLSENVSKYRPPPLNEDLSWMNPKRTKNQDRQYRSMKIYRSRSK